MSYGVDLNTWRCRRPKQSLRKIKGITAIDNNNFAFSLRQCPERIARKDQNVSLQIFRNGGPGNSDSQPFPDYQFILKLCFADDRISRTRSKFHSIRSHSKCIELTVSREFSMADKVDRCFAVDIVCGHVISIHHSVHMDPIDHRKCHRKNQPCPKTPDSSENKTE